MNIKRSVAGIGVAVVGLAGVGLAAAPAFANDNTPAACVMRASTPVDQGNQNMEARGGRGSCSNPATVTLMLKRDIPAFPDSIIESSTRSNIYNATWSVYGVGASGKQYYTQSDSSTGASMQSSRITLD